MNFFSTDIWFFHLPLYFRFEIFSFFHVGDFGGNSLGLAQTRLTFRLLVLVLLSSLCWQVLG